MENQAKYVELTKANNWKGIFELNDVKFDSFGTKKELNVLHKYLEEDEVVYAIVSGVMSQTGSSNSADFGTNTWISALTNERFLCLDAALLTSSVDTQSIRLENVQGVSASQGWVLGKVSIDIGNRTIVIDNCVKESVSVMATLANKLLKEARTTKKIEATLLTPQSMSPLDRLEAISKLHKFAVINDVEYKQAVERVVFSSEMAKLKAEIMI